jgi:glutamyl-tRNA reductase
MDEITKQPVDTGRLTAPPTRQVFPVGLLVERRPCLVVGGGKVAERKVRLLRDAGADVRVVSPELTEGLSALVKDGAITVEARAFLPGDPRGMALVFAATNEKFVNRQVLEAARAAGVPCCPVDGNWAQGDFVTPAVLRRGDLTVAISTGGRSCRKSRMIREDIEKHVALIESADLLVLGTSHDYLPIEKREPLHLAGDRMDQVGKMLTLVWGVHEFVLLNTCNRIEFIGTVSSPASILPLLQRLLRFDGLKADTYYVRRGMAAFEHLAVLTAGLLSQTPGEGHITAQVKEALDYAAERTWAGPLMHEWGDSALHTAKDMRQVTAPLLRGLEIEDLGIEYLTAEYPSLAGKRVMVIGSGVIGQCLVERILPKGASVDWIYHATRPELPPNADNRVFIGDFNRLRERLPEADVVIAATSSAGHILHQGHAPFLDQEKPILMLDLAIPRNIAPELSGLTPKLRVVDLDDLKAWSRRHSDDLVRVYELSRQVVREHTELYERLVRSLQSGNARE